MINMNFNLFLHLKVFDPQTSAYYNVQSYVQKNEEFKFYKLQAQHLQPEM